MIPDNSADVGTHSVELCKELFDEFVFMLETEFGEERIKLDRVFLTVISLELSAWVDLCRLT